MTLPEAQIAAGRDARGARRSSARVQGQARIIDDLLDMSRTNAGKLAVNRVPLLLLEAIQPCMTLGAGRVARARASRLYAEGFDDPIHVDGDPVRIEQIAWNLLSNAIKFTAAGGKIVVRVVARRRRCAAPGHRQRPRHRAGVPAACLRDVPAGRRGDDARRGRPGHRPGDWCKSLVELHGGRVDAESAGPGRGATFKVWLPLHQETDFAPLDEAGAGSGRSPALRVLLVDDAPDALETFGYLLEHEGAVVTCASSGAEALALCAQTPTSISWSPTSACRRWTATR